MNQTLSRQAALDLLGEAVPRLGLAYADGRNTDRGPGRAPTTSRLSPYLRRRLLLETEAVAAAFGAHGEAAAKFTEEVFWRGYFKGYLETRPYIWRDYRAAVAREQARLDASAGLRRAYEQAVAGRTGIDGFDDWARALVAENWLHNHARMWFASIWIFTLGLPWALGADFFAQHLIDGDPASNTLGWRWVAGLHTKGKPYVARAENIRRFTEGRYSPSGLNEVPEALEEPEGAGPAALPRPLPWPAGEVALLLHLDDLCPETLDLGPARVVRICPVLAHMPGAAPAVRAADASALADGVARAAAHFGCEAGEVPDGLPLVAAWAQVGPSAEALPTCLRVRRPWDEAIWPRSTAGFFKIRAAIPKIWEGLAAAAG